MKRFFAFTMALAALLFVACESEESTQTSSTLTRTSSEVMEFDAVGGSGEITFTIENPAEGVQVIASCDAEWIDGLTSGTSVTFEVLENTSEEARNTKIVVTYGEDCSFEVAVTQKGASGNAGGGVKEVTMDYFYGTYYGDDYSDTYNYYVVFSDYPCDEEGYFPTDAAVYSFDLYSLVEGVAPNYVVPNGTYTFDLYATAEANTIADGYSYYSYGEDVIIYYQDVTLEISSNKCVAVVKLESGETHRILFEGALNCVNDSSNEDGGDDSGDDDDYYYYYSNLTDDFSFNIAGSDAYAYASNYGDWYGVGCNNIYVELYENINTESGVHITLDLLTSATSTDIEGTYTPYTTSESDEYLFVDGWVDEEGYINGSWLTTIDKGEIAEGPLAPIVLGSVEIEATAEEGVYAITIDCLDDAYYAITGTFKGTVEFCDYSDYYAAPKKQVAKINSLRAKSKVVVEKNKSLRRR